MNFSLHIKSVKNSYAILYNAENENFTAEKYVGLNKSLI